MTTPHPPGSASDGGERTQQSPMPQSPMPQSDEAAVLAANAAFYAAFNARDTDAMAALWATAAEVSCVHPGWNILRGREAVLESWRSILGNAEQAKIMGAAETAQIVGEVALVVGRELVGGHPIAVSNTFLRQRDGWKLLHHHASPVARP